MTNEIEKTKRILKCLEKIFVVAIVLALAMGVGLLYSVI